MEIRFFNGRDDLTDAFFVRDEVFTKEQGFTIPDVDAFDAISDHMVVYIDGKPAATGRVYRDESGAFHIGRIAVLKQYRARQLGRLVMERLEVLAREQGAEKIVLGAQLYAIPFYEKCGFQISHRVPNFFLDHYDHPIFEGGKRLIDMVYLEMALSD